MEILLNGEPRQIADDKTLTQLLADHGYGERRVAVEINHEIVPRSRHAQTTLKPNDRVEIVHAIGGG